MKRGFFIASIALSLLATACAHHRDVRPGSDGVHRVVLNTENKSGAYRKAMSEANHFCKERGGSPVIVDENSKYTGGMDEDTYNGAKTAAKVATVAGGATYALGGKRESNIGGIVGLGGGITDSALGKGYTYELRFKCQ